MIKTCGATGYFLKGTKWMNRKPVYRCRVLDEIQLGSETSVSHKWWRRQLILCGILQPLRLSQSQSHFVFFYTETQEH